MTYVTRVPTMVAETALNKPRRAYSARPYSSLRRWDACTSLAEILQEPGLRCLFVHVWGQEELGIGMNKCGTEEEPKYKKRPARQQTSSAKVYHP
jgi:hypothetical protein